MARKTTYKRRPNNSGTVVKLSGKRRKPYCAKISSEERDIVTGKKKQVTIGTFETELEALNALSLYHLTVNKQISDKEAKEFYFLGEIYAKGSPIPIKMEKTKDDAFEINYTLDVPVRDDIYEYMTS